MNMPGKSDTEARDELTPKQRDLLRELEEVASSLRLDYQRIKEYEKDSRTPHLERMKRHLIIGEVVMQYTLIDEYLNVHLCHYFFGRRRSFIRLWKTKKFQNFNYHILEPLSLIEKLRFVKSVSKIPKAIGSDIERINGLRNGLAHAFFPENLRSAKPIYKGKSIFAVDGIQQFVDDMAAIS
jgi:hypothetical protein